ncbi:hypothetical protein AX14_012859 [Amanita brunnescens Koide BX004]|nr:hypothetical protein AX14_012859 [Amanita brunnescens Koide BX004]
MVGADVVIDAAGHAYRAYLTEKGEKKAVVVRPDGVAGAIVRGTEGVKAYLGKIFVIHSPTEFSINPYHNPFSEVGMEGLEPD